MHFARIDASCRYFRNDAFEVAHLAEFHLAEFAKFGLTEELFHTVEARVDVFDRTQGEEHPSTQLARSHGGEGAIEHLEERTSISVVGAHQFEVANGEFV